MNATRILPDLQCSLLCEDVRPEANGNFILVGVIGWVRVPQVPVTAFKLCVFNRWTAGLGQFTENVRLIAPDQTTVLRRGQVKFVLQDASHHATNVTVMCCLRGFHFYPLRLRVYDGVAQRWKLRRLLLRGSR